MVWTSRPNFKGALRRLLFNHTQRSLESNELKLERRSVNQRIVDSRFKDKFVVFRASPRKVSKRKYKSHDSLVARDGWRGNAKYRHRLVTYASCLPPKNSSLLFSFSSLSLSFSTRFSRDRRDLPNDETRMREKKGCIDESDDACLPPISSNP